MKKYKYIYIMNIVFFGASTTEQKYSSGYVPQFQKLILDNSLNFNIIQKGYGGMHLNDAGIIKINDVIDNTPNVCFINWFSSGYIETNKDKLYYYLDIIVRKLMLINCKICFLLLDRRDMCENRLIMFNLVIEYSNLYNLDYIELYNNSNVNELLRDDVHTNESGAIFYATEIFNYFMKNMINKPINYTNIPEETSELYNIKVFQVNKQIDNEIIINGNFKIIGIFQRIGTFSGLVEITNNNATSYKFNLWDQWCHFERNSIKIQTGWSEEIKIKVLQDSFDTEICKNKDINFNDIQKFMHIHEIYYIGNLSFDIN
jgi:hypothetical protein